MKTAQNIYVKVVVTFRTFGPGLRDPAEARETWAYESLSEPLIYLEDELWKSLQKNSSISN